MPPDRRNPPNAFASASGSSRPGNTKFKPPRPARKSPPPEEEREANEQRPDSPQSDPAPTIPPKLISRLLHEHFEDEGTRISKDANAAVGNYMELFVKEALASAIAEHQKSAGGAARDSFLEVEDLEKVAPKLLLDF
ncbi:MAG: hypothetical protein M1839_007323 [Geoglossum umbratile]|nr:MAG: hypothetical protein M1839_007323 [Geoglossum umbratile]